MVSSVSFGSVYNTKKLKNVPSDNVINATKIEIKKGKSKDFSDIQSDSTGRNQVKQTSSQQLHKLKLSTEDKKLLSELNSKVYGFSNNSNNFWVHSRKPAQKNIPNITMGDGKIQNGMTRREFVKGLINDKTQAFQIAGNDKNSEKKSVTVVKNVESNTITTYNCDSEQCYKTVVHTADAELEGFADLVADSLDEIQGITVWEK